jgi:hypothetical protein
MTPRDRGATLPDPTAPGVAGAGAEAAPAPGEIDQPLLALPDPTARPTGGAPDVLSPAEPAAQPAQAPSRPSFISKLFSGRLFRR